MRSSVFSGPTSAMSPRVLTRSSSRARSNHPGGASQARRGPRSQREGGVGDCNYQKSVDSEQMQIEKQILQLKAANVYKIASARSCDNNYINNVAHYKMSCVLKHFLRLSTPATSIVHENLMDFYTPSVLCCCTSSLPSRCSSVGFLLTKHIVNLCRQNL